MQSPAQSPNAHARPAHAGPLQDARRRAAVFILVFLFAFGVRLLCWQAVRFEVYGVQTAVAENYKHLARLLVEHGAASFYDPAAPTSEPDLLGHPPGYPLLLAGLYAVCGESDAAAQIFQAVCDALTAALVFLVGAELLTFGVGIIAGLLAALAPQFCWNSLTLLPDTLAVLPLLAAVWLLARAHAGRPVLKALGAGVLFGLSCWLRANVLLLAPFAACVCVPLLFRRGARLRPALALVAGALAAVAPLTIRNAVVYGHFIPVSLGAGQTLIEGLADYDRERRFGLPDTDQGLTQLEASEAGRPEYAAALFTPDGIERDRRRTRRALKVIGEHPVWFAGVMLRRAGSMWRLERTPLSTDAPVAAGLLRAPGLALRAAQRLFITAIFLPLYLLGLALLLHRRKLRALVLLLTVPFYFLCVQSALHTEYRYVLALHYCLFVVAAYALQSLWLAARHTLFKRASR